MTENNKRFVTMANIDLEVSIKDNLTKKYPFSLCCENLDEFESLLNEVTNVCAEMNKAWGQTQRFEAYNKRLMEENKQLNQAISDWKGSYDELYQDIKILEKENKELKAKVDDKEVAVEVECEKLMQKVFDLIDVKIKEYQKYDGYDTEKYYIGTQLLNELKRGLVE